MSNLIPSRVAAVIYALVMIVFGVNHFMNADKMGGAVPTYMPGAASMWVYITGGAFVAAGLAIIINKFAKLACYLLALLFLIFVFGIHLQMAMGSEEMMKTMGLTNLLKDLGLAMGAILIGNISK